VSGMKAAGGAREEDAGDAEGSETAIGLYMRAGRNDGRRLVISRSLSEIGTAFEDESWLDFKS
jgi:hypothetical protein